MKFKMLYRSEEFSPYKEIELEISGLAEPGVIYLVESGSGCRYFGYASPASEKEARKVVDAHNTIRNSPLMKALK